MKKYLFIIILCILPTLALHPAVVFAAGVPTVVLQGAPSSIAQQQQFYVDVLVDPEGISFNGVQGAITFSDSTVSFVRAETGTSNVTLFIDQPTIKGNRITFSGIIPGGFDGQIDPFSPTNRGPAEIMRLFFTGKAAGIATITSSNISIADNDGHGTLETLPNVTTSLAVSSMIAPSVYPFDDTTPPMINASVVTDKNLYNGKYTLIFTAIDKQSGVDHVALQEGDGAWTTIQSPYLLHDQSRHSILSLRAYDVAGNVSTITIASLPSSSSTTGIIILVLIVLISLYVIYKKTRHHKNIQ